jgi:hypothetical protein
MATNLLDCQMTLDDMNGIRSYSDELAVMLAVKNLLLGAPGNWPFDPDMGIDIEQYQFEFADSTSLNKIKRKVNSQINKYIPSDSGITTNITLVEDTTNSHMYQLKISVAGYVNTIDKNIEIHMLVGKDSKGGVNITPIL